MATKYHTVKKGETLGGIASKYKTTVKNLAKLNNIKNLLYQVNHLAHLVHQVLVKSLRIKLKSIYLDYNPIPIEPYLQLGRGVNPIQNIIDVYGTMLLAMVYGSKVAIQKKQLNKVCITHLVMLKE